MEKKKRKKKLNKLKQHKHANFKNKRLNPWVASFRIIFVYLVIGFSWIFFSDRLLASIVLDQQSFQTLSLYKGWFYVFVSALVFFIIILRRVLLYVETIDGLDKAYLDLEKAHKELISYEKKLRKLAYYDELTELPAKSLLEKEVKKQVKAHQKSDEIFGFAYLDLNDFRDINEMHGYDYGDQVLKSIAQSLAKEIDITDFVSRMSEDEFVILITHKKTVVEIVDKIKEVIDKCSKTYKINQNDFPISFGVGISIYPKDGINYMTLLRHADMAMSSAKKQKLQGIVLFDEHISSKRTTYIEMTQNLRLAITNKDFELYYQPIYDLKTKEIISSEALIRWNHASKGFISPMDFIPIAEITGLIHEINDWVFFDVFSKQEKWKNDFNIPIRISINISAKSLINEKFISSLETHCKTHQIECGLYDLEVTETAMIENLKQTRKSLEMLNKMGFSIALDDFGTGYSSLTYLKELPIKIVKIDRSFISNCIEFKEDQKTLKYIIELAHHLNMKVVAEGIETLEQMNLLESLDCDYAQGYFLNRPLSLTDFEHVIGKQKEFNA